MAANGDETLVDRFSLQESAKGPFRPFPAVRLRATQRIAARRRDPAREETMLFSFNCAARTSTLLEYRNGRSGTRRQDWQGADSEFRYAPPRSGSIAEIAMIFACSGGRLPVVPPKPADSIASTDDPDGPSPDN